MKFHLVLDEPREHDRRLEVRGLHFAVDAFAASYIEQVTVDFDEYEDSFIVINEAGPNSAC
ncbi:hypothetical protein [Tumebacillus permanentifrigoris]|uniref:Uncharacterized protein n=1 Tax=Tumebacillus permanentifrigoris TaxID=378543 RepID=A0A316D993_9BACL|nr:hypothetical protein [Tumebacillus permanentifrigoris]PWK13751.1 hypothetical protein C7459_10629 [Tumebacillus permanentifrigoris]